MIRLLEFHRSPNCAKVRIALNYKGLPYETKEMSNADRKPLVETAGWPLVPVIVDGTVRMRDSEAILHYLESNYRESPSLTPSTLEGIRRGEALRDDVQLKLRPILRAIYQQALREPAERDLSALRDVLERLREALEPLERALGEKPFLTGDALSIYDVALASPLQITSVPPEYAAQSPLWAFLQENVSMPEGLPRVSAWRDRVLAYDEAPTAVSRSSTRKTNGAPVSAP